MALVLICNLFLLSSCTNENRDDSRDVFSNTLEVSDSKELIKLGERRQFIASTVTNFKLLDQSGRSHELQYYDDSKAIVLMVHDNDCTEVQDAINDYSALNDQFLLKKVTFFYINSSGNQSSDSIERSAKAAGIGFPILVDKHQIIGRQLGLSHSAEVIIIDPRGMEVVYRGPLNNQSIPRSVKGPVKHYAEDALNAFIGDRPILEADSENSGKLIEFPELPLVNYEQEVAPILLKRCVRCHQKGGIAPWAMSSHAMVHGFAPMIREVINTRRMPPFHADPDFGRWREDILLNYQELQTLFAWLDQGALNSKGDDPLKSYVPTIQEWDLGTPDLIVNLPDFSIPATGILEYRYIKVDNPLSHDVWVSATSIKPGDAAALHHVNGRLRASESDGVSMGDNEDFLLTWAAGVSHKDGKLHDNTGVFLPKGGSFLFEMHYTSYGKASIDRTQVALYFSTEAPKKVLRYVDLSDKFLTIPAFRRSYFADVYITFDRDAEIHAFGPHAHYRGKSFTYTLRYPDGSEEIALSVPDYDFNWQRGYFYLEPKFVPAGTKVIVRAEYDNSKYNSANPDSSVDVKWGQLTADEMLTSNILFTWSEETPNNLLHNTDKWTINKYFGYLDANMDGFIVKGDFPISLHVVFDQFMLQLDTNNDRRVTLKEWYENPRIDFLKYL